MKKISYIISAIILSLGLQACSDILDKQPLDKYSEDDVWKSPELTQAFIYTTLSKSTDLYIMQDTWTDNSMIQENQDAVNINKEQIDRYKDVGWNKYEEIRRCNQVLKKMGESTVLLEKDKDHFIGQAKMLRAMIYFSRARYFGKLMIVDRVIDHEEDMQFPRTETIKETYDFIVKDLQDAIPLLPSELLGQQGMLTQSAAYALLAEVALHGAAYIETGKDEYLEIAKQASEDLFDLSKHELDKEYKNLFNDYNYAMNSKEIILAKWRHQDNTTFGGTWMQSIGPNVNNDKNLPEAYPQLSDDFECWPTSFPSVDLVNDYLVIDTDGKAKDWDKTSYYQDFKNKGGYVSDAIYKNRDARFYASIVYDSTQYFKSIITTREKGNNHWNSNTQGDWGVTKTGYIYRKGMYETKRIFHDQPTFYHNILFRLGRSYLNYAEVMLLQGNTSTAIEYINKTRVEHGGLPALATSLPTADAWKEYKRERRVELAMEGDRYWCLLRWGKFEKKDIVDELTIEHKAISISADGKSFKIIPLPYRAGENARTFTSKRYLMPVPQGERDENPALDQNEGW